MYNRKIYKIKGTVYTVPFSQAVCSLRKIEVGNFLDSVKLQSKAYKTFDKNSLSRAFCGFPKSSLGSFSSVMTPSLKNITLFATSLANPISCVTITIVMPSLASSLISSSTSPTISGSSADVGSSKSITSGFIASARTIAIRCF